MIKIIKDSIYADSRLISIQTYAPKFLDAEIEKHRMISSNSSSSRAIPVEKMLEGTPFIPADVRLNQSGMQGYANLDSDSLLDWQEEVNDLFKFLNKTVVGWNTRYNIHKQHLNRYLEAFIMQTKIMTANKEQWDYFLNLRDSEDADPAIQSLAKQIRKAIATSEPQELAVGEWHLPYVDSTHKKDIYRSVARCARTSYKTHAGAETTELEDKKLTKFLISHKHLTPLEHQASPLNIWKTNCRKTYNLYKKGVDWYSGNFRGWFQYRQKHEV